MQRRDFLKGSFVAPVAVASVSTPALAEPTSSPEPKVREQMYWGRRFQRLYHVQMAEGVEVKFDGIRFVVTEPNLKPTKCLVVSKGLTAMMYTDADESQPAHRIASNGNSVERHFSGQVVFKIKEIKKSQVASIFNRMTGISSV